ncbi:MAG: hypothetical protein HZA61_13405 [Candidatus Eisenbacteria bacterium]|uniref:TIGR03067 domain-containing protein n=1 Tax=Eiseniibacteriota bacterium TaxID=2212470 RepID=A0A933SEX3_UNCEI|nr:hypothetical protein [Candidatus Eisenbacteria bacterium]
MHRTARRITLSALAALALSAAPAARPSMADAADLSTPDRALEGIWRLDFKRSDDPAKAMPRGGPGGPGGPGGMRDGGPGGPGGMGGPPRGGGHGGPGGMGGPPDRDGISEPDESGEGPGGERREDPMRRVLHPGAQMVIFVLSENVEVTEDERPPLTFALQDSLDAHGRVQEIPGPVARWKKSALVTTFPLGRSGALTETYELSADGRTLTVRVKATGGPQGAPAITLKRVYERYDGE